MSNFQFVAIVWAVVGIAFALYISHVIDAELAKKQEKDDGLSHWPLETIVKGKLILLAICACLWPLFIPALFLDCSMGKKK